MTGAAGFIGLHFLKQWKDHYDICAVIREGKPSPPLPGVQWIALDLSLPFDETLLPERVDAVLHLAQSAYYRNFPERAWDIFAVNIQSTLFLLDYARRAGARRFLLASTGGLDDLLPLNWIELGRKAYPNFYSTSKLCAEQIAANYSSWLDIAVFRLYAPYGPGQTGKLIPNLLEKVRKNVPVDVDGERGLRINPIFIGDVSAVLQSALECEECRGIYDLCGDEVVSVADMVELMGELSGVKPFVQSNPDKKALELVGNNTRMKERFRISSLTTLREGLLSLIHP